MTPFKPNNGVLDFTGTIFDGTPDPTIDVVLDTQELVDKYNEMEGM
jgi:hypothetical protein